MFGNPSARCEASTKDAHHPTLLVEQGPAHRVFSEHGREVYTIANEGTELCPSTLTLPMVCAPASALKVIRSPTTIAAGSPWRIGAAATGIHLEDCPVPEPGACHHFRSGDSLSVRELDLQCARSIDRPETGGNTVRRKDKPGGDIRDVFSRIELTDPDQRRTTVRKDPGVGAFAAGLNSAAGARGSSMPAISKGWDPAGWPSTRTSSVQTPFCIPCTRLKIQ